MLKIIVCDTLVVTMSAAIVGFWGLLLMALQSAASFGFLAALVAIVPLCLVASYSFGALLFGPDWIATRFGLQGRYDY